MYRLKIENYYFAGFRKRNIAYSENKEDSRVRCYDSYDEALEMKDNIFYIIGVDFKIESEETKWKK